MHASMIAEVCTIMGIRDALGGPFLFGGHGRLLNKLLTV